MGLAGGSHLGPYEIVSPLGAGGMGEVYRALDTRLERHVAIKVLPAHLSSNPDLKQRFEREARVISALNHPHICTVFDVGSQEGVDFLVMELLEGESLSDRLHRGALPLEETLRVAGQIAEALARAHGAGVTHRDLKPGNIMLTKAGAKLLDFGLAKPIAASASASTPSTSVFAGALTMSSPVTAAGTIVGTVQYMAPEQIEGNEADARSDIFAFGLVLYEMLSGRRAFQGKTQASVAASILALEAPPLSALAPMTPPGLERLVRACLEKDPEERIQSVRDLKIQLNMVADLGAAPSAAPAIKPRLREQAAWAVGAVILIAVMVLGRQLWRTQQALEQHTRQVRSDILPPTNISFYPVPTIAISPDGRRLAYVGISKSGGHTLFVRPLDSLVAQPIAEVQTGLATLFWSPDGRFIGFAHDSKLKKIDANGGAPEAITTIAPPNFTGATWNATGDILFTGGPQKGLSRVSAAGGPVTPATKIDTTGGDLRHEWPYFLPDGRHFLYLAVTRNVEDEAIMVGSLDGGQPRLLMRADSPGVYAPPGYLLFLRDQVLMAQKFNARALQLEGDPFAVAENISFNPGSRKSAFTAAQDGSLVYQEGGAILGADLAWMTRDGKVEKKFGHADRYLTPRISPDGKRIAIGIGELKSNNSDIWIQEVGRESRIRLTSGPGSSFRPFWSPDGQWIIFTANRGGTSAVYRKSAAGTGAEELLVKLDKDIFADDISADGRYLALGVVNKTGSRDIWIAPMFGDKKPFPLLEADYNKSNLRFSPDGRWLAYETNETGASEIYLLSFPDGKNKIQISTGGGGDEHWSRKGRELIYRHSAPLGSELMSVEITPQGAGLELGQPRPLFDALLIRYSNFSDTYDVTADGQNFVGPRVDNGETRTSIPLTLVQNWLSGREK